MNFEDSYWWRTVRSLDLARPTDLQTEAICHVWEPSTAFRKAVHFGQSTDVVRLPFTDVRLCSYVQSLPAELKYNGKVNKWILRAYMKANLPREIVENPSTDSSSISTAPSPTPPTTGRRHGRLEPVAVFAGMVASGDRQTTQGVSRLSQRHAPAAARVFAVPDQLGVCFAERRWEPFVTRAP